MPAKERTHDTSQDDYERGSFTRREILKGVPIRKALEGDSSTQPEEAAETRTRREQGSFLRVPLWIWIVVLLLILLASLGAVGLLTAVAPGQAATAADAQQVQDRVLALEQVHEFITENCKNAGSNKATRAQNQANSLETELAELRSTYPDLVAGGILAEVRGHVKRGEEAKALARYQEACQAFTQASEQAWSALHLYLTKASKRHIDAVSQLLADAENSPPPAPDAEAVAIEQRLDRVREQVAEAETLGERRQAHQRTRRLRADAERELPPSLLEQASARVNTVLLWLVVFFGGVAVVQGSYLLWNWGKATNSSTETETEPY